MTVPTFIHVGFANSGTTSLQQNFFAKRDDIFYVGEPYHERGGIFTIIKSVEDFKFDLPYVGELCERYIHAAHRGRTMVISDEALCDSPELYYAPYTMPRDIIALRLKHLFPNAKIIFTIRDQRRYVASMYSTLKRNAAFFDRMPMPPFSQWLAGMVSSVRRTYLHNLNFLESIGIYAHLFGRANICVLPLEIVIADGAAAYLGKLCEFMALELTDNDIRNFATVHNRRMSARRDLAAQLITDGRFDSFLGDLVEAFGQEQVDAFLDGGTPTSLTLEASDEARLQRHIGCGNWVLARQFGLELERYGYPMMDESKFSVGELDLAEEQLNFASDIERSTNGPMGEPFANARREAEILAMRARLAEFIAVNQSPLWRVVSVLDRIRRHFRDPITRRTNPGK